MNNDIEWKMVKLGDITQVFSGGTPSTEHLEYWNGDIPWMNSGELNLKIVNNVEGRITELGLKSSSTHWIPIHCVLIGLAGQGKTRGTAAYNTIPLCTNQSIAAIYPNDKVFNSKYLYYFFDTQYEKLRELSSGGGGRGGLNKNHLLKYIIPLPYKKGSLDLETQAVIAQKLSDMDSLIAAKEKLLAKKRNLKVAAMQKLIKDEEGENWKKVKIGDFLRVKTGSKNTEDKIDDGKYPLYVRSPIVERINEYTHDCEAVLTAGDGVGTGKVFHYVNGKFAAHQRVYVISNFTEIDGKYFYYQFSQNFYDEVMKYTAKSSVDSVRRGMITGMEIALPFYSDGSPDLIEQRRIASILSDMDSEISAIEKEITKLQNLKTAMMQKMFCFADSDSSSE